MFKKLLLVTTLLLSGISLATIQDHKPAVRTDRDAYDAHNGKALATKKAAKPRDIAKPRDTCDKITGIVFKPAELLLRLAIWSMGPKKD